jgi:hypothetical protein
MICDRLTERFFREWEDDSPHGPQIPNLDDYTTALAVLDARMTCDKCGGQIDIGSFPFCKGNPADHGHGHATVRGDEIDFVQHNGTKEPIRFRSRGEFKRWLKEHNYEVGDSHVPLKGSDKSPYTSDWSRVYDDYTANNVKELLERAFHQKPSKPQDDTIHFRPLNEAELTVLDKKYNG